MFGALPRWRGIRVFQKLIALALASPTVAHAQGGVNVECRELGAEDAAQLEARARASLLGRNLDGIEASIHCADGEATIRVSRDTAVRERSIPLAVPDFRDAAVAALEDALAELDTRHAGPPSTPAPPLTEREAKSLKTLSPPQRPGASARFAPDDRATFVPSPAQSWLRSEPVRLGANLVAETWSDALALGVDLSVRSSGKTAVAFTLGVRDPLASQPAFSALEILGVAHVGRSIESLGLELALGLGVSALSVTPENRFVPSEPKLLVAPFVDASFARPIWFGRFALVVSAGTRLFTGSRRITVDASEQLVLPVATAHLAVGLAHDLAAPEARETRSALRD